MKTRALPLLFLAGLLGACQSSSPDPEPQPAPDPMVDAKSPEESPTEEPSAAENSTAENPAPSEPGPTSAVFDRLWNYQDPVGTRGKFEALLDEQGEEWPLDLRLQLMTQIARTHGLVREFDASHAILDEVEESLPEGPSVARIRYYLERGRSFRSNQEGDKSRPLFTAAWEASLADGESYYAVDAAHMLGILETGQASLDWNHRAMEAAEASEDPRARGWLGALYNNTGWTHHENGDYPRAMDLWVKAEKWHKEFGSPRSHRIAIWTIARCERSLKNYEKALEMQRGILAMDIDPGETGYAHEEAAENLWALGEKEQARAHFASAHGILSKDPWLQANEPERLARLERLAQGADE